MIGLRTARLPLHLEHSSSPLYIAPNSPSFSQRLPIVRNENQTQRTLDANDHIAMLKYRLLQAQEHSRIQQNTLDHILRLLHDVPGPQGPQIPKTLVTPADSIPNVQACGLKPSTPNDFDGDCFWGQAFLNSYLL